jgi:hypothetical protein
MKEQKREGSVVSCSSVESQDWYAWIDLMPPGPNHLHVMGEVQVPNPGVDPFLATKHPQGINPSILLLDLHLVQRPGIWPDVVVWKQVRYDRIVHGAQYRQVQVFCEEKMIADMSVEIIS